MGNFEVTITVLCMLAIFLLVLLALCRSLDLCTWIIAWINSTREEKVGLTRLKGHYNANGVLVNSDSDIHLDATGSFKRFDSVDRDFKVTITTTSLTGDWKSVDEDKIPPQPLRPAPVPIPAPPPIKDAPLTEIQKQKSKAEVIETLQNIAIPRPVSSISISALASQSQFPVCITPPPTPVNASQSPKFQQNEQITQTEELDGISTGTLRRAISCDSVCSDSSVALGDLEDSNVTGYLCIGLEYDSDCSDLIVNVLEAKDLVVPAASDNQVDSYVRVSLLPDKDTNIQTRVYRGSHSPSYKERFLFTLHQKEQPQKSLCFHVYSIDHLTHTLIGEGELRLNDVSLRQPVTTWITLTDTGQQTGNELGELMFSLSYLPTAERLTVVVVKGRNLKFQSDKEAGDPFVKVYLLQHGKKVHKKKTSTKKSEKSPIFNESMIFSVPAHTLQSIQLRLTVADASLVDAPTKTFAIGHVIVGGQASGRSLSHWNQMLAALRKPVAMWHGLRK